MREEEGREGRGEARVPRPIRKEKPIRNEKPIKTEEKTKQHGYALDDFCVADSDEDEDDAAWEE